MPTTARHLMQALVLPCLLVGTMQARAANCESLATLQLPDTIITLTQAVAAGGFAAEVPANQAATYTDLPAFCRVAATIAPTSDSAINIEVWLPAENWNGKFQGVGNGGWSGSIANAALAAALSRGYAAASTDTGHVGGSASFALGHPEQVIDFGYRAIHEMTVKGKALATAYYDANAPQHAYFVGCSAGGRQGMKAAQMYPDDYDGIIAGSPGLNWSGRALQTVWVGQAVATAPLPAEKFAVLNAAAIAACDNIDDVTDGVIENPHQCRFDPAVLQCSGVETAACLTPAQVDTARSIYADVRNSRSGELVVAGLSPGSETGWNTMAGAQPFGPGVDLFKYIVFSNAEWDFRTLNWDSDIARTVQASTAMDALDTNLAPFFARGGKLLSYHGWGDPQISPGSTVDYYESVRTTLGAATVAAAYRLYMVPGMAHCGGGTGTAEFDMLTALEQWVEQDQAPDMIPAARVVEGQTVRTRPLCPYPQTAVYDGSGSTDALDNFSCR
jgi:feruloyl esterase